MFGFRYSSLFKSRWAALLWAAGIVLSAWSFADDQRAGDGADNALNEAQMAAIFNAF